MINPTSITALQKFFFITNAGSLAEPSAGGTTVRSLLGNTSSNDEHGDFSTGRARTLPIQPFQQKRDADAYQKEWPDPMRVEVDNEHA